MREIFEEYGDFVAESIGAFLLLTIFRQIFFGTPLNSLVTQFISSAIG